MSPPSARDRFLALLGAAVADGSLQKLTLGKPRGADPTLRNVFVRPVALKGGLHFAFVWRHVTRDVTKNHPPEAVGDEVAALLTRDFFDAHLFTPAQTAQFEARPDGTARLKLIRVAPAPSPSGAPAAAVPPTHDRVKAHLVSAQAPWLRALGVTNEKGQPRPDMTDKFRQIQKFAELLSHLLDESDLPRDRPLQVVDMGSGKGYLTFALAELLGDRARIRGIEARPELVDLCQRLARDHGFAARLAFSAGRIADAELGGCDVLIALHACDTATDDALARGLAAGARLLVVAPCCQKEVRPQLAAPAVLAGPLRHGIFQERQAEFVTDALRAELLEWAGYRTKVFEFIATEHTAKNLMIAAIKARPAGVPGDAQAERTRALAAFYGVRRQRLAAALGLDLAPAP